MTARPPQFRQRAAGRLAVMIAALAAYTAIHSPLLMEIGHRLGRQVSRCYFACSGWSPGGHWPDALAALIAVVLAVLAARVAARRLDGMTEVERWVAFGVLLLAATAVPAAYLGYVGWLAGATPLRPPAGPLVTAIPSVLALATLSRRVRTPAPRRSRFHPAPLPALVAATGALMLVATLTVSLSHPPTAYDAVSYHAPMGVYFWRDGNLGAMLDRQPWAWALSHPGSFELWAGLVRLAGGERVADLAQVPFTLVGCLAVYLFGRRSGLSAQPAWLGAAAFLLSPMVLLQSGTQLNDVTAAILVMSGAALLLVPAARWSNGRTVIAGLALGLASATKLAILPAVGAVVLYMILVAVRAGRGRALLAGAAGFAVAVAPWWLRNAGLFANPIYPAALPLLGHGLVQGDLGPPRAGVVPHPLAWPLYPLLESHDETGGFGALFIVAALPGLVVAARHRRSTALGLFAFVLVVAVVCWWRLTRHDPRFLLGAAGPGYAFVGWSLMGLPQRWRGGVGGIIAAAAIFSALVTTDEGLRPLAAAPTGRHEFYDRVWGVDSAVTDLPDSEPLLSHTGFAPLSYAADYALLGPHLARLLTSVDGTMTPDSLVRLMRQRGIRYAYVPASSESDAEVRAMYSPDRFTLVRRSASVDPRRQGTARYLFRLREFPPTRSSAPPSR